MIEAIEAKGCLIRECSLPGETRKDNVFPAHPNGIPVSRNRWLIVYATRGWRCVDDDLSIVYQLREKNPDGPVIVEGFLSQARDDWDPFGDGSRYPLQHGHPVAFGVPKDAVIGGRKPPNHNLFVIKWRRKAPGKIDPESGLVERDYDLWHKTQGVDWVQVRLAADENDIEIVQAAKPLRQRGFEDGKQFCSHKSAEWINQSFVQAIPLNHDATEWVDVNHFDRGRISPLKYKYNLDSKLYEWQDSGDLTDDGKWNQIEASIARNGGKWLICSRSQNRRTGEQATGWYKLEDPFAELPAPVFCHDPATSSPRTLYTFADGGLRMFTGDQEISPYKLGRNPLYCWDMDRDHFTSASPRVVFDAVDRGLLPAETAPTVDMCKLLPHTGGREQFILWRVRTRNVMHKYTDLEEGRKVASAYGFPPIREEWKEPHGIYYGIIKYDRDYPGAWEFGDRSAPSGGE